ncbi:coiled-coil domain-containing protein [Rickettsiales endosymbiont of Stachyamoeba lipophora]|uniref:hypothetical protein n=1 Tax=Rickettsiales endosymbiont of Stachyamoeba lipophora TaxID=2486578 RepID=UPI000F651E77|nr:hypothetical protein [Rickettsiales endosymbiont of Stachyamoeba lipophora]AZL15702.1 hypothetical protein EF513_03950 [Rickettsiales endosymbiont of Stachyamoeba lipophora]
MTEASASSSAHDLASGRKGNIASSPLSPPSRNNTGSASGEATQAATNASNETVIKEIPYSLKGKIVASKTFTTEDIINATSGKLFSNLALSHIAHADVKFRYLQTKELVKTFKTNQASLQRHIISTLDQLITTQHLIKSNNVLESPQDSLLGHYLKNYHLFNATDSCSQISLYSLLYVVLNCKQFDNQPEIFQDIFNNLGYQNLVYQQADQVTLQAILIDYIAQNNIKTLSALRDWLAIAQQKPNILKFLLENKFTSLEQLKEHLTRQPLLFPDLLTLITNNDNAINNLENLKNKLSGQQDHISTAAQDILAFISNHHIQDLARFNDHIKKEPFQKLLSDQRCNHFQQYIINNTKEVIDKVISVHEDRTLKQFKRDMYTLSILSISPTEDGQPTKLYEYQVAKPDLDYSRDQIITCLQKALNIKEIKNEEVIFYCSLFNQENFAAFLPGTITKGGVAADPRSVVAHSEGSKYGMIDNKYILFTPIWSPEEQGNGDIYKKDCGNIYYEYDIEASKTSTEFLPGRVIINYDQDIKEYLPNFITEARSPYNYEKETIDLAYYPTTTKETLILGENPGTIQIQLSKENQPNALSVIQEDFLTEIVNPNLDKDERTKKLTENAEQRSFTETVVHTCAQMAETIRCLDLHEDLPGKLLEEAKSIKPDINPGELQAKYNSYRKDLAEILKKQLTLALAGGLKVSNQPNDANPTNYAFNNLLPAAFYIGNAGFGGRTFFDFTQAKELGNAPLNWLFGEHNAQIITKQDNGAGDQYSAIEALISGYTLHKRHAATHKIAEGTRHDGSKYLIDDSSILQKFTAFYDACKAVFFQLSKMAGAHNYLNDPHNQYYGLGIPFQSNPHQNGFDIHGNKILPNGSYGHMAVIAKPANAEQTEGCAVAFGTELIAPHINRIGDQEIPYYEHSNFGSPDLISAIGGGVSRDNLANKLQEEGIAPAKNPIFYHKSRGAAADIDTETFENLQNLHNILHNKTIDGKNGYPIEFLMCLPPFKSPKHLSENLNNLYQAWKTIPVEFSLRAKCEIVAKLAVTFVQTTKFQEDLGPITHFNAEAITTLITTGKYAVEPNAVQNIEPAKKLDGSAYGKSFVPLSGVTQQDDYFDDKLPQLKELAKHFAILLNDTREQIKKINITSYTQLTQRKLQIIIEQAKDFIKESTDMLVEREAKLADLHSEDHEGMRQYNELQDLKRILEQHFGVINKAIFELQQTVNDNLTKLLTARDEAATQAQQTLDEKQATIDRLQGDLATLQQTADNIKQEHLEQLHIAQKARDEAVKVTKISTERITDLERQLNARPTQQALNTAAEAARESTDRITDLERQLNARPTQQALDTAAEAARESADRIGALTTERDTLRNDLHRATQTQQQNAQSLDDAAEAARQAQQNIADLQQQLNARPTQQAVNDARAQGARQAQQQNAQALQQALITERATHAAALRAARDEVARESADRIADLQQQLNARPTQQAVNDARAQGARQAQQQNAQALQQALITERATHAAALRAARDEVARESADRIADLQQQLNARPTQQALITERATHAAALRAARDEVARESADRIADLQQQLNARPTQQAVDDARAQDARQAQQQNAQALQQALITERATHAAALRAARDEVARESADRIGALTTERNTLRADLDRATQAQQNIADLQQQLNARPTQQALITERATHTAALRAARDEVARESADRIADLQQQLNARPTQQAVDAARDEGIRQAANQLNKAQTDKAWWQKVGLLTLGIVALIFIGPRAYDLISKSGIFQSFAKDIITPCANTAYKLVAGIAPKSASSWVSNLGNTITKASASTLFKR